MDTQHVDKPTQQIEQRDKTKKELAVAKGITLVTVPFWWNGQEDR